MSNISSLIEVFKMDEVKFETRIRIIQKLGRAINDEMGMNVTGELVGELVSILDEKIQNYEKIFPNINREEI